MIVGNLSRRKFYAADACVSIMVLHHASTKPTTNVVDDAGDITASQYTTTRPYAQLQLVKSMCHRALSKHKQLNRTMTGKKERWADDRKLKQLQLGFAQIQQDYRNQK